MPPSGPRRDAHDRGNVDAELGRDALHRHARRSLCADLTYLSVRELRGSALFSAKSSRPESSLRERVTHVVSVRADEQVGRVHAASVVAVVAHEHPRRNRSVLRFPRDAMRVERAAARPKLPISVRAFTCGPLPAPRSRDSDLRDEPRPHIRRHAAVDAWHEYLSVGHVHSAITPTAISATSAPATNARP